MTVLWVTFFTHAIAVFLGAMAGAAVATLPPFRNRRSREEDARHSSPYRNSSESEEAPPTKGEGPDELLPHDLACPFCRLATYGWKEENGRSNYKPVVLNEPCSPSSRVKTGTVSRCQVRGTHVHRFCQECKARWLSALPVEKEVKNGT